MAKYKVWLTVKDSYGNAKEIDGGVISVDLGLESLTENEVDQLTEALPLEEYVKRADLPEELEDWATDKEVEDATANTVKYSEFKFRDNDTKEADN
jgi:hypothetical protein